jgi:hypothetical protein
MRLFPALRLPPLSTPASRGPWERGEWWGMIEPTAQKPPRTKMIGFVPLRRLKTPLLHQALELLRQRGDAPDQLGPVVANRFLDERLHSCESWGRQHHLPDAGHILAVVVA